MVHPEDKQILLETVEALEKSQNKTLPIFEYRIIESQGRVKYIKSVSHIVNTTGGKYNTGMLLDITQEVEQKATAGVLSSVFRNTY